MANPAELADSVKPDGTSDISALLRAWGKGDASAFEHLAPLVYQELRLIARRQMRAAPESTLQTTALVHEAYLRMVRAEGLQMEDRAHFFAVAAQMMRRILVDAARARHAGKRQGNRIRVEFSREIPVAGSDDRDLIALDDALAALSKLDERKARVVELRFFAGLSVSETAEVLGVSAETVQRDWRLAKSWLAREVIRGERGAGS
jgi:RNA polymerase sigma factor (TIGR02999 family)